MNSLQFKAKLTTLKCVILSLDARRTTRGAVKWVGFISEIEECISEKRPDFRIVEMTNCWNDNS